MLTVRFDRFGTALSVQLIVASLGGLLLPICAGATNEPTEDLSNSHNYIYSIVDHFDNSLLVDPGVADQSGDWPFFPSRATTAHLEVTSDQFDVPEVCGGCHIEIYNQWRGSMHSNAWHDPIYKAMLKLASEATEGAVDNFCMGCHTPVGVVTAEATPDGDGMSEVAKRGVQCDVCHNISASKGVGNGAFVLTPLLHGRRLKFGPFKDALSPYHDTAYSPLHTKSEFCGQCHDVTHPFNLLPVERTYSEWKDSAYAGAGIQCQDCHMTPGPGVNPAPGRATPFSKEREQIYTHYFVGGNAVVPAMLGSQLHSKLAIQMLRAAAELELFVPQQVDAGSNAEVRVRVKNVGAGHKLPTGFPEGREMWLDFKVFDADDKLIYRSGAIEHGHTQSGTKSFKVVVGDKDGKIVDLEVWNAAQVLYDTRILPQGYSDIDYSFPVPKYARGPIRLEVDLNYWSFSQALVDRLLGEDAPTVPIIQMESETQQIAVKARFVQSLLGAISAPLRILGKLADYRDSTSVLAKTPPIAK